MRIVVTGGELEQVDKLELDFTETNPFISDVGSQTLPVNLPASEHNLKVLGYPHRIARRERYVNRTSANVSEGAYRRTGDLVIFSAVEGESVTSTFYLSDGELYSRMGDVMLPQISYGPVRDPFSDKATYEAKADAWLSYFIQLMAGGVTDEFAVFPVVTELTEVAGDAGNIVYYEPELLNAPDLNPNSITSQGLWDFMARIERTDSDGNTLPVGYGVTPFLYVEVVLRYAFRHFGYELEANPFALHPQLNRMVLLNNTADSIVAGTLDYAQLVPTMKISEFIDAFRKKFDLDFMVDSVRKSVSIRFFHSVATEKPVKDYSAYVNGKLKQTFSEPKQVVLKAGKSLTWAETDADTLEELIAKYTYVIEADEDFFYNAPELSSTTVILRKSTGEFLQQRRIGSGSITEYVRLGSCMFSYNKKGTIAEQVYESKDEQVSLVQIKPETMVGGTPTYSGILAPVVGSRRHLNSKIKKANGQLVTEKDADNPMMLCFAVGLSRGAYAGLYYFGTPLQYDDAGNEWGDLTLSYAGEKGIFQTFWRARDAVLRHSWQTIICKLVLPFKELLSHSMHEQLLIDGQPLLPARLSYTIGAGRLAVKEAEFRTMRLLQPYNLKEEQRVPSYTPQPYYWVIVNNYEEVRTYYRQRYPTIKKDEMYNSPPSPNKMEPPTEEQYNTGGHFFEASYTIRMYLLFGGYVDGSYQGWYEVRKS